MKASHKLHATRRSFRCSFHLINILAESNLMSCLCPKCFFSEKEGYGYRIFALALLFFRNLGRPLSRAYIHEAVWQRDTALPSRTMDTHVSRVRNKLQLKPEHGYRLVPVYSYGYRLEKLGG